MTRPVCIGFADYIARGGLPNSRTQYRSAARFLNSSIPPPGHWKCFKLDEVRDAVLIEGRWHSGSEHSEAQHCMKMVEYDVNPNSPYNPAFKL